MEIIIPIKNKIAYSPTEKIVCGNSDYIIVFEFDEEWDEYPVKTARFIFNDKYVDVVFEGNTCPCPVLSNLHVVAVGVYAGDLRTTTPALIGCKKSILCEDGAPVDPPEDVYNQIMSLFNSGFAPKISTAKVGQTIVVKSVDENGKPTEWEAVDMASGGEKTVLLSTFAEIEEEQTGPTSFNHYLGVHMDRIPNENATVINNLGFAFDELRFYYNNKRISEAAYVYTVYLPTWFTRAEILSTTNEYYSSSLVFNDLYVRAKNTTSLYNCVLDITPSELLRYYVASQA